ncbi:MAG: hypothetical protein ABJF05_18820 [Paracoccaceae bacterium]
MANWREVINAKLDNYTGYDLDVGDDHIIVTCQNPESFDVSIHADGEEFQVGFDGWHEHFDVEEDALNCFAFGLSKDCRLNIIKRGNIECSWTAQALQDGTWIDNTTTGLILIPYWKPRKVEYRHNIISKNDP